LGHAAAGLAAELRSGNAEASRRGHRHTAGAGFSIDVAAHAYALLDAQLIGSTLQEAALPFDGPADVPEMAAVFLTHSSLRITPMAELTTEHVLAPGYDFGREFEFGLILNALQRLLGGSPAAHRS
jgi:hypothetical protein